MTELDQALEENACYSAPGGNTENATCTIMYLFSVSVLICTNGATSVNQ